MKEKEKKERKSDMLQRSHQGLSENINVREDSERIYCDFKVLLKASIFNDNITRHQADCRSFRRREQWSGDEER